MRLKVFICLLLAAITLAIYWPASQFTFLFFDDGSFLQAPQVAAGISPEAINWALTGVVAYNWHPITTSSFLLMHEMFGLDPGAEHLVNILFHAANAVLLFLVLYTMTAALQEPSPSPQPSPPGGRGSALWPSAIVAAIFAWHPLHVESVAWIAERKDVLFTFFMLLSLWCYVLYARSPSPGFAAAFTVFRRAEPLRRGMPQPSPPRGRGRRVEEAEGPGSKDSPLPLPSPAAPKSFEVRRENSPKQSRMEPLNPPPHPNPLPQGGEGVRFGDEEVPGFEVHGEGMERSGLETANDQGSTESRPTEVSRESDPKARPHPGPLPQERGKQSNAGPASEAQRPSTDSTTERMAQSGGPILLSRQAYYNLALLFFILSFLCKAMVVTLPFLMLLLDYWPLQRLNRSTLGSLIFEKMRFFVTMVFFCALTFWFQKATGATVSLNYIGVTARLENTVLNYAAYLGKFFWPVNLAIPNPFPASFDLVQVVLATLLLLAITALCILQISRRPYLAVGWFWYLGTMVPVIGLVQLGVQGMEDRYTYITLIGPSISLVWLVWEEVRNHSLWKYLALAATAVLLAVCAFLTEKQLQYWKDTVTLFSHTIAVTPENPVAEEVLAVGLEDEGLLQQAAVHYRIANASRHYGDHFMSNFRAAGLMVKMGYDREAETRLEAALQFVTNSPDALYNLAWLLATSPDAKAREGARAVKYAERACELTHYKNPTFMTGLAAAYAEAGRFNEAIDMTQKTITLANQYGLDDLVARNQDLLQAYTAHKTYAQTHSAPQGAVQSP